MTNHFMFLENKVLLRHLFVSVSPRVCVHVCLPTGLQSTHMCEIENARNVPNFCLAKTLYFLFGFSRNTF